MPQLSRFVVNALALRPKRFMVRYGWNKGYLFFPEAVCQPNTPYLYPLPTLIRCPPYPLPILIRCPPLSAAHPYPLPILIRCPPLSAVNSYPLPTRKR
jgi:hypothetical protein